MRVTEAQARELGVKIPEKPKKKPPKWEWNGVVFRSREELLYAQREDVRYGFWRYEPVTFHLPGAVKYTPDFMIERRDDGAGLFVPAFLEVKPAARLPRERDSIVRLKSAAAAFPMWEFYLARYDGKTKTWDVKRVWHDGRERL